MIKKFCSLNNVGKFANLKAAGDVEMRPLTLMYGENGRGKTTLCCVMRSLTSGEAYYLAERHTLGEPSPPSASILTDAGMLQFKAGAWSGTLQDIAVFDCIFVHENVCAGERVDHEHKKNLHRVIVGKLGVELNTRVIELDGENRTLATELRTAKAEVEKYVPSAITLAAFLSLPADTGVDAKIVAAQTEVSSLKQAGDIKLKSLLSEISPPQLPHDLDTTLSKELADVSADAEAKVREHLAKNTSNASVDWLQKGLTFQKNDTCPFCGQDAKGVSSIRMYKEFFSDSYKSLKEEIETLGGAVKKAMGPTSIPALEAEFRKNETLLHFWTPFVGLDGVSLSSPETLDAVSTLEQAASASIAAKKKSPLEPILPTTELIEARKRYAELVATVETYNASVLTVNERITACKKLAQDGNLAVKEKELARLQATKTRHTPEADLKCKAYQQKLAEKSQKEADKEAAKKKLDEYSAEIFTRYKDRINELLGDFNTSFRLGEITPQYAGGQPSSSYDIIIKNQHVPIGVTDSKKGDHCFSSTLSSGDRSTLALAFFLAQLEQDANYKNTVVVFDDPFTSQDRFRRTRTQQLISDKAQSCKQVIVLSHDAHFLKLIWDNIPPAGIKTLQLTRVGKDDATITEWDIEEATKSSYVLDYLALMAYLHQNTGTPKDIARKIRPILEGFLRVRFPTEFAPGKWLGQLIEQIRDAAAGTPLAALHGQPLDDLTSINGFSKTFHHETNPTGFDSAIPSDEELIAFGQKTIRFVGGF